MLGTGSLRGGACVDIGHGTGNQTGWNRGGIIARASLTPGKGATRVGRQGAEAPDHLRLKCGTVLRTNPTYLKRFFKVTVFFF